MKSIVVGLEELIQNGVLELSRPVERDRHTIYILNLTHLEVDWDVNRTSLHVMVTLDHVDRLLGAIEAIAKEARALGNKLQRQQQRTACSSRLSFCDSHSTIACLWHEAETPCKDLEVLAHTKLDGRFILRVATGQTETDEEHVERAGDLIRERTPAVRRTD